MRRGGGRTQPRTLSLSTPDALFEMLTLVTGPCTPFGSVYRAPLAPTRFHGGGRTKVWLWKVSPRALTVSVAPPLTSASTSSVAVDGPLASAVITRREASSVFGSRTTNDLPRKASAADVGSSVTKTPLAPVPAYSRPGSIASARTNGL